LKYYRDIKNTLDLKYTKGLKEGFVSTARNMKAKGYPIADIIELTGLTEMEINQL
jgi:hypothetical protein